MKITLLRSRDGLIRRVKLDGVEHEVAGPPQVAVANGRVATILTLYDAEIARDPEIDTTQDALDDDLAARLAATQSLLR